MAAQSAALAVRCWEWVVSVEGVGVGVGVAMQEGGE